MENVAKAYADELESAKSAWTAKILPNPGDRPSVPPAAAQVAAPRPEVSLGRVVVASEAQGVTYSVRSMVKATEAFDALVEDFEGDGGSSVFLRSAILQGTGRKTLLHLLAWMNKVLDS